MTTLFTWDYLESELQLAKELNYRYVRCCDYGGIKHRSTEPLKDKLIVLRIDIDLSMKKADRMLDIFERLGIRGSFFVRLHAREYNPFSFENFRIAKRIKAAGHEIGYHSEVIDQSKIWDEDPAQCLERDLEVMSRMYEIKVKGAASHGGLTGWNNLDFWRGKKPSEYGLLYEGYDEEPEFGLFHHSLYVSDSEWTRWKCYDNGKLRENDRRSLSEHAATGASLIYLVIHTDTYFENNCYENE
jgi:hypothetical protein